MIDSTNPRSMADNIRYLSGVSGSQSSDISTLQAAVEAIGSYSTNEVDTGMYYGDDKIYRKVFPVASMPNNTTNSFDHGVSNLKEVLYLGGTMQYSASFTGRPIPSGANPSLFYNTTKIIITTSTDFSANAGIIIFLYTKSATPASLTSPAPDDTRSIEAEEIPEDEYIEPEVREEAPEEVEPEVVEVKKTTRKKSTN